MPYVIEREPGTFEEIAGGFQAGSGEEAINHPDGWLEAASPAELDDARVELVPPAEVPEGMVVLSTRYARVKGIVTQLLELAPEPVVIPASVTPRQLRLALLFAGKLDQVEAFVASGHAPKAAVISWEYATEFLRGDPMLNELAGALQPPLASADIDALFVAASRIP
jgi:hypothetical protein